MPHTRTGPIDPVAAVAAVAPVAASETVDQMLAARYGTKGSRWPTFLLVGAVVAAALLAASLVAPRLLGSPVDGRVVLWQNSGPRSVDITLEVRGRSESPVDCVIRLKDRAAVDVGYLTVRVPDAPRDVEFVAGTVTGAASVGVLGCAPAGETIRRAPADYPPGVAPAPTAPLP